MMSLLSSGLKRATGITLILCLLACLAPAVSAHQQKYADAEISLNPRTGMLEIVTRFSIHDAEHALQMHGASGADITKSTSFQDDFAKYVASHFELRLENQPTTLDLVGYEHDEVDFFVYLETPLDKAPTILAAHFTALQDVWPEQINLVNLEFNGCVHSLRFAAGEGVKMVELGDKSCP